MTENPMRTVDHGPFLPPALLMARLTVALTWGWSAFHAAPWNDYGYLEDALRISKLHSGIPGWPGLADALLADLGTVGLLVFTLESYLFITLLLGLCTRLNGAIATLWAMAIVILAWNLPKAGEGIPESFPVPIGGWLWLLGPILLLPLIVTITAAGRTAGIDKVLRAAGLHEGDSAAARFVRVAT